MAKRMEQGDEEAKKRLSEANLRLVVSIAKGTWAAVCSSSTLSRKATWGLIKLWKSSTTARAYKFSTYATWWIRQAITRAIADQARTIRIPVHMVETINKLIRVSRQLLQEYGREPQPEEIAEVMGIPEDKVREIIKIAQEPVSLETPIGEEEDSHLGDFIPDDDAPAPADAAAFTLLKEQLMNVLSTLTPREEMVLKLRFGLEDGRARTLEEVGREFKVTRERIRQIEAKALRKLRHPSRSRKLKDSIDLMLPENAIALDARLSAIRDLAGSCARFADIGADHGRLGAHMLLHGLCERAQLADISEASLAKARRLIYGLGLTGRVDFCVGDGAQGAQRTAGHSRRRRHGWRQTIAGIVERGRDMLKNARLVLQPNVAAPELRARLQAARFRITNEVIARDGRRLYVIIAAEAGEMRLTPEETEVGPVLLRRRPAACFPTTRGLPACAWRAKALQGARRGHGDAAAFEREISIWEAIIHGDRCGTSLTFWRASPPLETQEEWDNAGLLAGDPAAQVTRVLVALDLTMEVGGEAERLGAQLIVTHHPHPLPRPQEPARGRRGGQIARGAHPRAPCHGRHAHQLRQRRRRRQFRPLRAPRASAQASPWRAVCA